MAEHLYTYIDPPSSRHLDKTIQILNSGGLIVLPTGTNWAICCDARNVKAIDNIRRLKPGHNEHQPFSFICSSVSMASEVGTIDNDVYPYLKKIWPGPYTIIVKRNRTLPRQFKDKRQNVGIRLPQCRLALALVEYYGHPLVATSVPFKLDGSPYRMGYEIFEEFGHAIDLLLDLGEELIGLDSTIVDFSDGYPTIIREAAGDISIFGISERS